MCEPQLSVSKYKNLTKFMVSISINMQKVQKRLRMVVGPFVVEKVVILMKMWKTVHWKAGRLAKVKKMRRPKW